MNLLGNAIRAAQQGLHIFPVEPGEKTPAKDPNGFPIRWGQVATSDTRRVLQWWTYNPEFNIGVACKPSGLLVVDCDRPKREYQLKDTEYGYLHDLIGPLVDGESVFDQCCEKYGGNWAEVQDTFRVATGSGGAHYYYRWPDGVQATQASIVKGILDIRGNGGEYGGYVLGEGSCTAKGSYVVEAARAIRPTPYWLVQLCTDRPRPKAVRNAYQQPRNQNFGGLQEAVRLAGEGNRNNALLWAARSMYSDGAPQDEALDLLGDAARAAGLGELEIRDTIRSAYRLQQHKDG